MKISIVTPSFNSAAHIRETIQSVVTQSGDFSIEYFVMDNCSSDGTREIVEAFRHSLERGNCPIACNAVELHFVSEPDRGMYGAINKGFARATGDVFAWINADDIYLPGAFATVLNAFSVHKDIHWIKGITSYITERSSIWKTGDFLVYTQGWIRQGIYGRDSYFIQQDSVFWRSWLWEKSGGIDARFKRAGDYYLWRKFAEFAPLVSIRSWVSCFRRVEGQISQDHAAYMEEVRGYSPGNNALGARVRWFFRFEKRLPAMVKPYLFQFLFGSPEYIGLQIDNDGSINRVEGDYYAVRGA
jgi:glycosyltransferase involved in cell wall biosynthesis